MDFEKMIAFAFDIGSGTNFIVMAIMVMMGLRSRRIGIQLGTWTFQTMAACFLVAALYYILAAFGVWIDFNGLILLSKAGVAFSSLLMITAMGLSVWRIYTLPPEADEAFAQFRAAMERLREFHGQAHPQFS